MKYDDLAIGVDIGGTNIKLGLIDEHGAMIDQLSLPVVRNEGGIADVSYISRTISDFIRTHRVFSRLRGVGIACPGILDTRHGIVKFAVNLGWAHIELASLLQEHLQLPVRLESDAVAGAMGERYYGAGIDQPTFLYVCIGTGVGASLIIDNEFYKGGWGSVINIGHTSIIHNGLPCECGNKGCLEKYVSAPAVAQRVRNEIHAKKNSMLHEYINEPHALDSRLVYRAAEHGDAYAREVLKEAGRLLGISLVNCLHLFGIENMIIGGGFSQAGKYFLDPARQVVAERFEEHNGRKVSIVCASHPVTSGVLGAAAHWFK